MPNAYPKEVRDKAREAWVSGEATIIGLARELGIERGTIQRSRTEEDWDGTKNEIEQEMRRAEVERLAEKREAFQNNSLQLWAFLHAQMFLRAKKYGTEREMPLDEAIDVAKILAACQTGYYMALGIDPRLEAKFSAQAPQRRVGIEYDPPEYFEETEGELAEPQPEATE